MPDVTKKQRQLVIDALLDRAKQANNSDDALKYSQAALNAANAKAKANESS